MTRFNNIFRQLPALETPRLILRRLTMEDAGDIFEYASDPEVATYVTWEPHRSLDDTLQFLSAVQLQYDEDEVSIWGITQRESGKVVGTCGFVDWHFFDRRAEIGYALGRPYWGQGLMTEAVESVISFSFERMELNRVEARCEPPNAASARVLEKAGMCYEGTLREHIFVKGDFRDLKLYAILRRDFEPRR